ncbi:MAG: hypothetical protein LBR74_04205 [Eubacterium sp.]|jgi:hypothetical protein|nr:hypothetical protein [Eubacterium sp.]
MPKKKKKKKSRTSRDFRIPGLLLQNFDPDDCCKTLGFSPAELDAAIEQLEQRGVIGKGILKI